jgi:hypothetical protein
MHAAPLSGIACLFGWHLMFAHRYIQNNIAIGEQVRGGTQNHLQE